MERAERRRGSESPTRLGGEEEKKKEGRKVRDALLSLTEREESASWQLACVLSCRPDVHTQTHTHAQALPDKTSMGYN